MTFYSLELDHYQNDPLVEKPLDDDSYAADSSSIQSVKSAYTRPRGVVEAPTVRCYEMDRQYDRTIIQM